MHDRLRLTQAKMPDEAQLELLAPWYTQNTSESRTLDFFDAIPKYPFSVTRGCKPKPPKIPSSWISGLHSSVQPSLVDIGVERNVARIAQHSSDFSDREPIAQ